MAPHPARSFTVQPTVPLFSLRMKRKQTVLDGNGEAPMLCLSRSQDRRPTSSVDHLKRANHRMIRHASFNHELGDGKVRLNRRAKDTTDERVFLDLIYPWTDTQKSVNRVLEHLKSGQGVKDVFHEDSINKKVLVFLHDITEECGWEDKQQHSWAAVEKPDEICLYGPYYPDYSKGEHSEDTVIRQTQELLESEDVSDDWLVFIFTLNSPCLARDSGPCMLNLVRKAFEWHTQYGIRTYIGYRKCWGFKGPKESLFRDISYAQFELIFGSDAYQTYLKTIQESTGTDLSPLCENLYSAIVRLLGQGKIKFLMRNAIDENDRKTYFKDLFSIPNSVSQDEKDLLTQEISTMLDAVHVSLSEEIDSLDEYIKNGRTFALDYSFNPQVCDTTCTKLRESFEQCWREMLQDRYAEFLRELLTEDFRRCTVQLFINNVTPFTKEYIQIGCIKFAEQD